MCVLNLKRSSIHKSVGVILNLALYFSLITATASQATNRKELKMEESGGGNRSTDIRIENFDVAFGDK